MNKTLIVLVTVVVKFSLENAVFENRVWGDPPPPPYTFPYLVRIKATKGYNTSRCTGSLISHNYVLTAGHCVNDKVIGITVYLGGAYINDPDQKVLTCVQWIRYNNTNSHYLDKPDIGLITLPEFVPFDHRISPIELPSIKETEWYMNKLAGLYGIVIGWGLTVLPNGKIERTSVPMATSQIIMDQQYCMDSNQESRMPYPYRSSFCTLAYTNGPCPGDSGGPFVIIGKQFGIVTGGTAETCKPHSTAIYVDILKYLMWIGENSDLQIGQLWNVIPEQAI